MARDRGAARRLPPVHGGADDTSARASDPIAEQFATLDVIRRDHRVAHALVEALEARDAAATRAVLADAHASTLPWPVREEAHAFLHAMTAASPDAPSPPREPALAYRHRQRLGLRLANHIRLTIQTVSAELGLDGVARGGERAGREPRQPSWGDVLPFRGGHDDTDPPR